MNWVYDDPAASPTTGSAKVVAPNNADWYGGWLANGPNSSWIAPNPDTTNNGPAPYTFTYKFDTTGYSLASLAISGGLWTVDDAGTVALNGNVLGTLGSGSWGTLNSFTAPNSDFVGGVNSLTITINQRRSIPGRGQAGRHSYGEPSLGHTGARNRAVFRSGTYGADGRKKDAELTGPLFAGSGEKLWKHLASRADEGAIDGVRDFGAFDINFDNFRTGGLGVAEKPSGRIDHGGGANN